MGSPPFPPYGQYYAYPPPPPPGKHMVGTLPSVMAAHQQYGLPPPPPPPSRRPWVPWLMPLFFVGNVGVFVYAMYLNNCPSRHEEDCVADFLGRFSFEPFSVNAWLGPAPETLVKLGALQQDLVVKSKEYWRLFSCIWLHGGVIHLFANMLSLLFVGIRLEHDFGFLRIGILYLISGATASLTSCMWHSRISLGASGALFGLLGSMLSELFTNWTIYENKCMALLILIVVIVINLAIGFLPQVDNAAHIGGFIAGYLLGFVLLIRPQYGYVSRRRVPPGYDIGPPKSKYKAYQYLFLVMAISFLAVGYYFGLTKFLHMISENKQTDGHKEL